MELTRVPGLRLAGKILYFELRPPGRPSRSGLFDRQELVKSGHKVKGLDLANRVFPTHTC